MLEFDALQESLLRAGIAPRHVRRYLVELRHHYDDLIAEEYAHGITGPMADQAAMSRLGSNDELVVALSAKSELRSWSARFPWVVFGVMPPFMLLLGYLLWALAVLLIGVVGGAIALHERAPLSVPDWFRLVATALMFMSNFLVGTSVGCLIVVVAGHQRMGLVWPLLGMSLVLLLGARGNFHADEKNVSIGFGTIFTVHRALGSNGLGLIWPTYLAQAVLLCPPLGWLLWIRRKAAL